MYSFLPSCNPLPSSRIRLFSIGCPFSGWAPHSPVHNSTGHSLLLCFWDRLLALSLMERGGSAPVSTLGTLQPSQVSPCSQSSHSPIFFTLPPPIHWHWEQELVRQWRTGCGAYFFSLLSSCSQCCQGSGDKTQRKWGQGKRVSKQWLALATAFQVYTSTQPC